MVYFDLFVWWHINLRELFKSKAILIEEQQWFYLTHSWGEKGVPMVLVHTFPKGISPKVNAIARLKFELAYNESVVQHFSYGDSLLPWVSLCMCDHRWGKYVCMYLATPP